MRQTLTNTKHQCLKLLIALLLGLPLLLPANVVTPEKSLISTDLTPKEISLDRQLDNHPLSGKFRNYSYFTKILSVYNRNIDSELNKESIQSAVVLPFSCSAGLLSNAEFESDFSGWDFFINTTISNDAYYGSKAALTSGNAGGVGVNLTAYENEIYSLEVYAKTAGAESAVIGIKFLDSGYNELNASHVSVNTSSYQAYNVSAIAPEGTAYVQAFGWKNGSSGTASFDGFCIENWNVDLTTCSGVSCALSPSWGNYVWAMDDTGVDDNFIDYDLGNIILCYNTDGSLSLKGSIINGHDADWHASNGTTCGTQDGWYLDLSLTDRQNWATYQGGYVQSTGCAENRVDWDFWEISGTLSGVGCNLGRTININSSSSGYRAQVGWGGNSQSCDFGISTWLSASENGSPVKADLYAHIDANCYYDLFPEDCVDGVDNDGDGLIDCYDGDCGTQLLTNESFEDVSGVTFNTSFQGNPALALPNNSYLLPNWYMTYGCGTNCTDSYWIDDAADAVNNPEGDYFIWMPGAYYCAEQSIDVQYDKCYEITIVAAAWSDPSPQSNTVLAIEAYGGGIDDNGSFDVLYEEELPASPSWNNLNWRTITFKWSPGLSTTTSIYISQDNATNIAKGLVIDQILVKEICCGGGVTPEISCEDGRDVELQFVGINNDIPKTLPINDQSTIDSIVVEVVYKGGNPGASITVEDANAISYTAILQSVGSNAAVYRTTLPATSSITYSNTTNESKAQSLSAFIFRNGQPGKTVVTEFTTLGGYNNTYTLDFDIPTGTVERNIRLALPISEITYDDRGLDFVATAGSVSAAVSKSWGPNGLGFPNGCCIDTVVFNLSNVAPEVDKVSVDIVPPSSGGTQSFVIAATVAVEIFCEEICGNGLDDDGDGYVDNEDQDCLCPEIYEEGASEIEICSGTEITFEVGSNAPNPPYNYIEFYRFDSQQANPYTTTDSKVWLGAFSNINNGSGSITSSDFPQNGNSTTYYVYGCVKPEPQDPTTCAPLVEYIITVNQGTTISASPDATVCSGTPTTLSASASGGVGPYTFSWDQGLGNGANKTVSPIANTTFGVTVTSANGCTDEELVIVSVMESPIVDAGQAAAICQGESTTLDASGIGGTTPYSYQWSQGLGAGETHVISPVTSHVYGVTLTSNNGCIDTDEVMVTVSNCVEDCTNNIDDDGDGDIDCEDDDCAPVPSAGNDVTICIGSATNLSASVPDGLGNYDYSWSHGLGSGAVQNVMPDVTTTFTVTVTNAAGCSGTAEVTVTVNNCPEVCADGIDNDGDGLIDCEDPDCYAVGAPSLSDDEFTTCPSIPLTDRVNLNDGNLQDPVYSVTFYPANGSLSMDGTGKFTYTPFLIACGQDMFIYEVCNLETGCCATASVILNIGDTTAPLLMDVPEDVTISCDEIVPDPNIVLAFDNCPGIYVDFDESSDQYSSAGCDGYTITRTWTAEDLCGNTASDQQIITVVDLEAPELFRTYTLANGKRLIAGVSQRGNANWKYISFPINFGQTPIIFSQVISTNEQSAIAVQHRNVSNEGFELALVEQEASDRIHEPEQIAWLAIEPDSITGLLESGILDAVNHNFENLNLDQSFPSIPHFFFATQTVNETDPYSIRVSNATNNSIQVQLDEETSKDSETTHADEALAYLALAADEHLVDEDGGFIGETGQVNLTNAWATVSLKKSYTKPSVLMGGITTNGADPVTVRVRNVTASSFEVRLQEWDSQDGNHVAETVSYLVVEGGLPDDLSSYCAFDDFKLQSGINVFIRDNCDNQLVLDYDEISSMNMDGLQIIREWSTSDDCGNSFSYTRDDACTVAAIRLNALLHGALMDNVADPLMSDELRAKGLLPLTEPYTDLSYYQHKGKGGGETTTQDIFDVTGENAIVDWMFLEVRDSAAAEEVLATTAVLLKRNGEIINTNGEEVVYFPNLREGSYHLSFRHRNHVGIGTGHSWYLSSINIPRLDFTDPNVSVFDKEASFTLINGRRALWAGDFNGDRNIIYQGPNNDVFTLFGKVLSDPANTSFLANYISFDYDRTDIDMDGKIIYQGPDNEKAKLLYFTILSHPLNQDFLANYIVSERLP